MVGATFTVVLSGDLLGSPTIATVTIFNDDQSPPPKKKGGGSFEWLSLLVLSVLAFRQARRPGPEQKTRR